MKKTKTLQDSYTRKCIDEYIGKHFRFLENFLNGGYENYVSENLHKITHQNVFGVLRCRSEYKNIHSEYFLEQRVLDDCEKTLDYIKQL